MPLFSIDDKRVELLGERHYIAHDATLVGAITLIADGYVERAQRYRTGLREQPLPPSAR